MNTIFYEKDYYMDIVDTESIELEFNEDEDVNEEDEKNDCTDTININNSTKPSFVYLLAASYNNVVKGTYIGATIDLDHRLRQHRCELKGGAKQTSAFIKKGFQLNRICYVSGFPTWNDALKFEWRWKQITRAKVKGGLPLIRRMKALHLLVQLPCATTTATPYIHWQLPITIHFEKKESEQLYQECSM